MKFEIPEKNREQIAGAIMALLAAILGLGMTLGAQGVYQWLNVPAPVVEVDPIVAMGDTHFSSIVTTGDITSGEDVVATGDVTAGDDLVVTDDITAVDIVATGDISAGDDLGASGDLIVVGYGLIGTYLWMAELDVQAVVTNGAITPAGTYSPITSTAAIVLSATTSIANGANRGELLLLINENAADTITVKDAANTALTGDIALGPKDALLMIWDGADWVEVSASNN